MTTLPDMANGPGFSFGPRGLLNCEFMLQNNGQTPTRHGRLVELNIVGMPARVENERMLPSKRRGSESGEEEVWKSLRIENMELPE
jgi:hypothetical protein